MQKRVLNYNSDVFEAIGLSICDFICVILGCALLVAPWRLIADFPSLKETQGTHKVAKMAEIAEETVVDLLYVFPLALIFITLYRIPRLFSTLYRQNSDQ